MNEDTTLAEIIEASGGDVEIVRAAMIDALSELPKADELDVEQLASDWLAGRKTFWCPLAAVVHLSIDMLYP